MKSTKRWLNGICNQSGKLMLYRPNMFPCYETTLLIDFFFSSYFSQGSTPKHTLNLALHMMATSDPPTVIIDSKSFPNRFANIK